VTDLRDSSAAEPAAAALRACPHLRSLEGPWHGVDPSRSHRCEILVDGRPTLERQRLHCLGAAHVECPTWVEAHGSAGPLPSPGVFVSTAPIVLEGPGVSLPTDGTLRRLAAPATVVVVGAALGALALSRGPLAPGPAGVVDGRTSPAPEVSAGPTTAPSVRASASLPPRPTPAATPRPASSPTPSASAGPRTYKVRPGDTLARIAARFGTTVGELATLNGIANPSLIRVGQVLKLP